MSRHKNIACLTPCSGRFERGPNGPLPHPHHHALQPKNNTVQQMKKPVAAPAVYRAQTAQQIVATRMAAQPRPTALQPKMASVPQVKPGAGAPPVYKPHPLPKVLQPKSADIAQNGKPQAPAPYRPMPTPRVLQAKLNGAAANSRPQAPANQRVIQRHSSVIQMYDPNDNEVGQHFIINYPDPSNYTLAVYVRRTGNNQYVFRHRGYGEITLGSDRIQGVAPSIRRKKAPPQKTISNNTNNSTTTTSSNKKRGRPSSFNNDQTSPPTKKRKGQIVTRILREDQLQRSNMGINTTRKSRGSFARNLPENLTVRGGGKNDMSRLYTYMRKYGGAGMQGYHKDSGQRPRIVKSVLDKMRTDKNRQTTKFTMVAIDTSQLSENNVFDLTSQSVQQQFQQHYNSFTKMYETHRKEGVVVVKGGVPRKAVVGLRAFRDVPTEEELKTIIEELTDEQLEEYDADLSSDEDEPMDKKFNNNGPQDPPPGATGIMAF